MGNAAAKLSQAGGEPSPERKALLLKNIREGIEINPHYRKLTPMVADQLARLGDWENAIWIWESVAASRPHIAAIWSNLARGYARFGQSERALIAVYQWRRLQTNAFGAMALKITLLRLNGQDAAAAQLLSNTNNPQRYDYNLLMDAYALGLEMRNWPLAIKSLELRNQAWPQQAGDGLFKLGMIYADPTVNNPKSALKAFKEGLATVPEVERNNFRRQVPHQFQSEL
jgi:hypothetical protein